LAFPIDGGCTCRTVRYRMITAPMFVHCCHCRWCQRETGASFALNAMVEADRVELLQGSPDRSSRATQLTRRLVVVTSSPGSPWCLSGRPHLRIQAGHGAG
jgi:hypothetical protein